MHLEIQMEFVLYVLVQEKSNGKIETMIASESVALDSAGFKLERDLKPGEAIFIDTNGDVHTRLCSEGSRH